MNPGSRLNFHWFPLFESDNGLTAFFFSRKYLRQFKNKLLVPLAAVFRDGCITNSQRTPPRQDNMAGAQSGSIHRTTSYRRTGMLSAYPGRIRQQWPHRNNHTYSGWLVQERSQVRSFR